MGGLHERAGERPRLALCFSAEDTYEMYLATQKRYQPGHAARFCKVHMTFMRHRLFLLLANMEPSPWHGMAKREPRVLGA